MKWLLSVIKSLSESGWYGKLVISFEAGRITLVRKEETLKPPE